MLNIAIYDEQTLCVKFDVWSVWKIISEAADDLFESEQVYDLKAKLLRKYKI